ncbi:uncharacterized protein N7483_001401 [Penicillium malachiteum]|uniref:uncharacterized protein n=1 Tax=Penicillium malachiteum TaxID=1324776 RepID=UPI0025489BBA|nr:uncharacterized protein N7483_001401 [Penicillium malachiteum]KAJ5736276.1 hypothetical protein N7483_001401 [Penicillium malachiteum]
MGTDKKSTPAPPTYEATVDAPRRRAHTNAVIAAGNLRSRDEQDMQNHLQKLQLDMGIYNSDIEPEHDSDWICSCPIHIYKQRKMNRLPVQNEWSKAVMYPGEKSYHDCYQYSPMFSGNPYQFISAYTNSGGFRGYGGYSATSVYGVSGFYGVARPDPYNYTRALEKTLRLNRDLNRAAQISVDQKEPKVNIWTPIQLDMSPSGKGADSPLPDSSSNEKSAKSSKLSGLRRAFSIKSSEERAAERTAKAVANAEALRNEILYEENGRWPDESWRRLVAEYQSHVGMTGKIADLRARFPLQYLHLLRAGYFEPIPVDWANLASNPLKFSIEAASGWRGITPGWRGFEDTAEERLYWVLNHREGVTGPRMKPDPISAMQLARARMASAVEPPPAYFSPNDTCHVQHKSDGYSKQVMPAPFRPFDAPEVPSDDTMILLDVSGSMNFDPVRPIYQQALVTAYERSYQPKNKDLAKAIIRRFTDAMINHDHNSTGYQLVTFDDQAEYIGFVNHKSFEQTWGQIRFGGRTRVMTGWQLVKNLHFQKHSESAFYHPVYGWQAGPETPKLRLLLLLDGEASDMDEFELDLLSLSWVHVTIFLIGVDGCPHHHRHANELQRISEVNPHVSFVDAQGNTPERFVTHELLKRHLGYDVSMSEFVELEQPPAYTEL